MTKMMTFLTVIRLMRKFQIDPMEEEITVSKTAAKIQGTTANLKEGDILTVEQLCYGMMLPSGNDAAYALAEHFGNLVKDKKYSKQSGLKFRGPWSSQFQNTTVKYFLSEMNGQANRLKMSGTVYDSPHGLANKMNMSTAEDQAYLVCECMKYDFFR